MPWRGTLVAPAAIGPSLHPYDYVEAAFLQAAVVAGRAVRVVERHLYAAAPTALVADLGGERLAEVAHAVVLSWPDGVGVAFCHDDGGVRVRMAGAPSRAAIVAAVLARHALPRPAEPHLHVLAERMGGLYLRALPLVPQVWLRDNYAPEVAGEVDHVLADLAKREPCGRVALLYGAPGTGKSRLVEGMLQHAARTTAVRFVVVPPGLVSRLGDPGLLDVFADAAGDAPVGGAPSTFVLVLEDSDKAVRKRSDDNLAALSTLLNLSDGLVGRALDLRVLATTNAEAVEVDPALLRAGRLCRKVHVGPLPHGQARRVAARLGRALPKGDAPVVLADIYGAPMNADALDSAIRKAQAVADGLADRLLLQAKKWSRAFINDLPDAAFAGIAPGGTKDGSGKTAPRDLRLLPHHNGSVKSADEDGSVDLPHLRNALARLDQVDAPAALKARMRRHLEAHAARLLPSHGGEAA